MPVGSALDVMKCKDPEVLLSGSAGTGKTRANLEKIHALCMKYDHLRAVILRKTATSLGSTALVTFREHVAAEAIANGEVKWYGGSGEQASCYKYMNGSTITVGGMDKATRILSSEYDIAYVNEAIELTEEDWEFITTRLRNNRMPYQQIIADTNPSAPTHWLKQRCEKGKTTMIYCTHEHNPRYYSYATNEWTTEGTEYISKLDALGGVRKERLRYGKWAAADGLVYDTFDTNIHMHKHVEEFPFDWPRYWSVDFGLENAFVWQMWAQDPDGRLYMYKEIYETKLLVEDACRKVQGMVKGKRGSAPDPVAIICDHDAEGRATIERHMEMSTIPAMKSVLEGIEAVKKRLEVQEDGKPRLFLCRDTVTKPDQRLIDANKPCRTSDEILEYVWDNRVVSGTGTFKDKPLKNSDHGMDAMRYVVTHIDIVGRPRVRWM